MGNYLSNPAPLTSTSFLSLPPSSHPSLIAFTKSMTTLSAQHTLLQDIGDILAFDMEGVQDMERDVLVDKLEMLKDMSTQVIIGLMELFVEEEVLVKEVEDFGLEEMVQVLGEGDQAVLEEWRSCFHGEDDFLGFVLKEYGFLVRYGDFVYKPKRVMEKVRFWEMNLFQLIEDEDLRREVRRQRAGSIIGCTDKTEALKIVERTFQRMRQVQEEEIHAENIKKMQIELSERLSQKSLPLKIASTRSRESRSRKSKIESYSRSLIKSSPSDISSSESSELPVLMCSTSSEDESFLGSVPILISSKEKKRSQHSKSKLRQKTRKSVKNQVRSVKSPAGKKQPSTKGIQRSKKSVVTVSLPQKRSQELTSPVTAKPMKKAVKVPSFSVTSSTSDSELEENLEDTLSVSSSTEESSTDQSTEYSSEESSTEQSTEYSSEDSSTEQSTSLTEVSSTEDNPPSGPTTEDSSTQDSTSHTNSSTSWLSSSEDSPPTKRTTRKTVDVDHQ